MPVPSNISDLSKVASENSPAGTESVKGTIDDYLRAAFGFIRQLSDLAGGPTVTLASASTVNIGFAGSANILITGTTTINAFDSVAEGTLRWVTFAGALTLTHNAASLQLPGSANIATAAGDVGVFKSLGAGNWKCVGFQRASGAGAIPELPLAGGTMSGNIAFANNGPGIQFKLADGSVKTFVFMGADGWSNIYNGGATGVRIFNQAASTVLWTINNSGASTHYGRITSDTSSNGGGRGFQINNTTNPPEMAWVSAAGSKAVRVNGNTMEWLNSAYTAVIMSLTDAGELSAPVVTATSDETKKKAWKKLSADLIERLAGIKKAGVFRWKTSNAAAVGIGAQSLEAVIPEAVYTDAEGGKTVNNGGAAMAIIPELCRELVRLRARLAKLEGK